MIKQSNFKPAWWLRSPHLQTLWPKLFRATPKVTTHRERLELPDGDFLDLNFTSNFSNSKHSGPIVLILHGLEGSIESSYAAGILKALDQQNYRAVLMHFRNCSGEPNRLTRSYHSGETEDAKYVIQYLHDHFPDTPLSIIGYSLGGNVLLKLLGEQTKGNENTLAIHSAIAVSVPFLLNKAADKLNKGFSKIYRRYLINSLIKSVIKKHSVLKNNTLDLTSIKKLKDFWQFDNEVTAKLHGFDDVHDYYGRSSSRQYLKHIKTPTLILHSQDDPFISADAIPTEEELSDVVILESSTYGGHVGFISGNIPGRAHYWLEKRILEYLK